MRATATTASLLAALFLGACASNQPKPIASFSSAVDSTQSEPRELVAAGDTSAKKRQPSTNQASFSQTTSKRGKIQSQETQVTEVVETDISTVIDASTAPTSDQEIP